MWHTVAIQLATRRRRTGMEIRLSLIILSQLHRSATVVNLKKGNWSRTTNLGAKRMPSGVGISFASCKDL